MKTLKTYAIPTRIFQAGENIFDFLTAHLQLPLHEGQHPLENNILAITSKIVSLSEGRVVTKTSTAKKDLVIAESDTYLTEGLHGVELTLTKGILIPSAGIDESNSASGGYILFPKEPYVSAKNIHQFLKKQFQLNNFGVVLTDSHSSPLRRGVNGIALAHWGFRATNSLVGENDIFNKPLKFTHVNVADAVASMAVFAMGEGSEGTPLAIVKGASLQFTDSTDPKEVQIAPEEDIYYPLLERWLTGKK